ncbi:hypothetical protein Emag_005696 [Eimeria magna]
MSFFVWCNQEKNLRFFAFSLLSLPPPSLVSTPLQTHHHKQHKHQQQQQQQKQKQQQQEYIESFFCFSSFLFSNAERRFFSSIREQQWGPLEGPLGC